MHLRSRSRKNTVFWKGSFALCMGCLARAAQTAWLKKKSSIKVLNEVGKSVKHPVHTRQKLPKNNIASKHPIIENGRTTISYHNYVYISAVLILFPLYCSTQFTFLPSAILIVIILTAQPFQSKIAVELRK